MRTFLGVCLAAPLVLGCSPAPRPRPPAAAPRAFFRFHADLWPNLHEVLLHEALLPRPGFAGPTSLAHQTVAPVAELSGEEAAAWHDAVGYYDAHFATDDLFTVALESATRALSAAGSGPLVPAKAGVPDEWRAVLTRAEPVYRAHFWTEHERGDRAYIAAIEPLVAPHAAWFAERLARIYDTPWPGEPILVEVTEVVPAFGASTFGEPPYAGPHAPLITVSCRDAGYAGDSGVEMIFHESSHVLVEKLQRMLDESAERQRKKLWRGMWHYVLFFTAGRLAKERFGPGYLPYWERPEMQRKAPPSLLPVLEAAWQPYIDGKGTLPAAVDALVAAL